MDLSAVHTSFTRRRWVCLIAAMVICVCAGFGYAWSVLQNPIITRFGWADSGVALAYTITVLCSTMAPLIFGGVIRRLSTRSAGCPPDLGWWWERCSSERASSSPG